MTIVNYIKCDVCDMEMEYNYENTIPFKTKEQQWIRIKEGIVLTNKCIDNREFKFISGDYCSEECLIKKIKGAKE